MGQVISRLNEKYLTGEDRSNKLESKGMLDITADENDLNGTNQFEGGDILEISKTPPNIMRLKCDPRSPSNFNRTPLKVPVVEEGAPTGGN